MPCGLDATSGHSWSGRGGMRQLIEGEINEVRENVLRPADRSFILEDLEEKVFNATAMKMKICWRIVSNKCGRHIWGVGGTGLQNTIYEAFWANTTRGCRKASVHMTHLVSQVSTFAMWLSCNTKTSLFNRLSPAPFPEIAQAGILIPQQ